MASRTDLLPSSLSWSLQPRPVEDQRQTQRPVYVPKSLCSPSSRSVSVRRKLLMKLDGRSVAGLSQSKKNHPWELTRISSKPTPGIMAMSLDRTYTFGTHLKFLPAILANFAASLAAWWFFFSYLGWGS